MNRSITAREYDDMQVRVSYDLVDEVRVCCKFMQVVEGIAGETTPVVLTFLGIPYLLHVSGRGGCLL